MRTLGYVILALFLTPILATARGGLDARPPHGKAEFPQTAYAACAGKSIGDAATDGQVTGTCQRTKDNRVALKPSTPPPPAAPAAPAAPSANDAPSK